ncbi:uncharacterized protein LOC112557393 isoform X1 [Pomacea canaliculata]|uniref:uncharacterized protein LOC112557393 isoform X1 n=1 Tax=Pomacea canaliculata TaxID=400727 RepID=UPI000D73B216|nr:uncharacterized protein LOC112557393 isoform X1 [Pomacea canaliculata]
MATLVGAVVALLLMVVVWAAEQTANLQLSQSGGSRWEGKACFHLESAIGGWEVVFEFAGQGVRGIEQWDGVVAEQPASGQCGTRVVLVNKPYQGMHNAGDQLCVPIAGAPCGSETPSATARLVDPCTDVNKAPPAPQVTGAQEMKYNYAEVLQKSILFYEAQRSGKLPASNRIPWRGDSALQDRGDKGEDLTGGWYDAGDNVKFNFPMAFSTTVLCWSLLEFKDAYEKAGQLDYMYDSIRWPLEYFIKCHTGPNELYVQVGDGGTDHGTWTSPELMDQNRPAFKITASSPGSDVADETAAALTCGYLAFKTKDATFANEMLTHAKQIYQFAKQHPGFYSTSVNAAAAYYKSGNYTDEMTWAAAWLYKATNDQQYLTDAEQTYIPGAAWGFSWDEKLAGNMVLLYDATHKDLYKNDIVATMTDWMPGGSIPYSPKCLAFRLQWGSLRYASNTAFIALLAARRGINADKYNQWGMCQIHYALGDTGRSFVVGFGVNPPTKPHHRARYVNPPTKPHHRASSCPCKPEPCTWDAQRFPGPNPKTLYGALVGGPGSDDSYTDDRGNYINNEVACDYNAGFQGSVAALLQLAIDSKLPAASSCGKC